ncbi:hypothetical protein FACUT_2332 [Fusarium acutatum]|uniref:Uncharacterized protein n=1 Tax=Fusarium acutatum TaxID=78861 RepID=A0A8H4K3G1_9HYPO|nr:hypothetical protein FACUT_2332 [Fusarium acutatum]
MVIFTGNKSVAINSPRHLTLRQARNAVQSSKNAEALETEVLEITSSETSADEPIEDPTPPLEPGQAQLHSYWASGLEAGKKPEISVVQDIKALTDESTLRLIATQNFYVEVPQPIVDDSSKDVKDLGAEFIFVKIDLFISQDFKTLNFTQPPHQQRFAAGRYLEAEKLEVSIGRQFTVDPKYQDYSKKEADWQKITMLPSSEDNWFTWSTVPKPLVDGKDQGDPDADLRILRLHSFVQKQMDRLNQKMGSFADDGGNKQDYFRDDVPNSALFAMQLNDLYYQLFIA